MIRLAVADVVKRESGMEGFFSGVHFVVVLYDEAGRRALPIWVGHWEGMAIALGLTEFKPVRPLTFAFTAKLLEAAGAKLEAVQIESLKEDTFYAVALVRAGETVREVDARPSDAIALALQTGASIYASEEVMQKGGLDVAARVGEGMTFGRHARAILEEMPITQPAATTARRKPSQEEFEQSKRELLDYFFGRAAS